MTVRRNERGQALDNSISVSFRLLINMKSGTLKSLFENQSAQRHASHIYIGSKLMRLRLGFRTLNQLQPFKRIKRRRSPEFLDSVHLWCHATCRKLPLDS